MSIKFKPLTDEQIDALRPSLIPGITRGKVFKSIKEKSKFNDGEEQIFLTFKVTYKGREFQLLAWQRFSEKYMWQVKNFWDSAEEPQVYLSGNIDATTYDGVEADIILGWNKEKGRIEIKDFYVESNERQAKIYKGYEFLDSRAKAGATPWNQPIIRSVSQAAPRASVVTHKLPEPTQENDDFFNDV